jgi:predicted DNA-binding helix-hairpin-helix protein
MSGPKDPGEKIAVLAGAAKHDASCASSGSGGQERSRSTGQGGGVFGLNVPAGVCHSWTEDGRCVSLLKVLFSNACRFDCAYCVNRASDDTPRASFTVSELVDLTRQKSGKVILGAMGDFSSLSAQYEEDRRRVKFYP